MKKLLIGGIVVILGWFLFDYLFFYTGTLYVSKRGEAAYVSKVEGETLYLHEEEGLEPFEVKGVNMGLGKPGYYATEKAITKEEYIRWFGQIKEMGANVIRVYTLGGTEFYDAFYEYNYNNPDPLYLIHGVWVDDYLINSIYSAWDKEFYEPFLKECKKIVDVVHGRHKSSSLSGWFSDYYNKDISPWVFGYILGVEWESTLVSYTDHYSGQMPEFEGTYFYTEDASNFEKFLASIGEQVVTYETKKYGAQRALAFANWATTDPFDYEEEIEIYFNKDASVDVEHIKWTDKFVSGQFASYHIYPYYPDYYSYLEEHEENTYLEYLTDINEHHTIPVIISEFGVPSSRGKAAVEVGLGRNQGGMSETEQGEALISMYEDIKQAGSAGGIVFTWQDEWFKRTWNTMANINLEATPYWSDYQTNEQYFGLLSFDPGAEESICYVDGDKKEWSTEDVITEQDSMRLSMKYDEKFLYFLAEQDGLSLGEDKLFIPLDITPKTGAFYAENLGLRTSHASDFVIEIDGEENSRVWVQERYCTLDALFYEKISARTIFSKVFPEKDSETFVKINLLLQRELYFLSDALGSEGNRESDKPLTFAEYDKKNPLHYGILDHYETGKLTYGNANPKAETFNSLADFCAGDGFVEIKIPWQLLNFADPSQMYIHDDYYEDFGVEYLPIQFMNVGLGNGENVVAMESFELQKLGKNPEYHERLKESYYILQDLWMEQGTER